MDLWMMTHLSVFVGRQVQSEEDGEGERVLRLAQTLLFHLCDDSPL
jgi:hypothetical protein